MLYKLLVILKGSFKRSSGFDEEPLLASLHIYADKGLEQDVRVFARQAPCLSRLQLQLLDHGPGHGVAAADGLHGLLLPAGQLRVRSGTPEELHVEAPLRQVFQALPAIRCSI